MEKDVLDFGVRQELIVVFALKFARAQKDFLQKMRNAGFKKVEIMAKNDFMGIVSSIRLRAYKLDCNPGNLKLGFDLREPTMAFEILTGRFVSN